MPPFSNKPSRRRRKRSALNPQNVLTLAMIVMVLLYIRVYLWLFQSSGPSAGSQRKSPPFVQQARTQKQPRREQYSDWRSLAVDLAGKRPADVLRVLKEEDPFGVRTFEKQLLETESNSQRFLQLEELQQLFPCPADRITLPDQRNSDKARAFRNGTDSYFLFFQHLRKAGGTNFCTLAEHNLAKQNLPKYYCSEYDISMASAFGCTMCCLPAILDSLTADPFLPLMLHRDSARLPLEYAK